MVRLLGEAWASVGVLLGRVLVCLDFRLLFSIDKLTVLCYTAVCDDQANQDGGKDDGKASIRAMDGRG